MNPFERRFQARQRKSTRCHGPAGHLRTRLNLEGLETRLTPGVEPAFAFVVPVSQPADITHVHTLAEAVQQAGDGGVVTIEPGASPDAGQVFIGNTGITVQGDPNVPAAILPSEQIIFIGANSTLTNLNLVTLQLGTNAGNTSTFGNHVSRCIISQGLFEDGVRSTFTQNTITGFAVFFGNPSLSTNGDLFANNVISGSPVAGADVSINGCDGITVTQNTLYVNGSEGIAVKDSGKPNGPICTIANNLIVNTSASAVFSGILIDQVTGATNASILNNTIMANGGGGLGVGCAMRSNIFVLVQGNYFHGAGIGVTITGDGTGAGNVDLGGGSFNGMGSSLGGNDFREFTTQGTFTSAAIALLFTSSSAVIPAAGNIFSAGVSPSAVVDDSVHGSRTGTGQINVSALDNAHAFVQTLYNEVLGRTGTSSELNGWVSVFNAEGQAAVATVILHSSEALGRIVDSFYLRFLGRQADSNGRAGWISFLQNGGTEEQVESLFLTSPEYVSHINVDYVQSLYINILGRSGSAAELAQWNNNLQRLGLVGIANGFVHSAENRLNTLRSDFQTFLHRTPTDTELMPLVNTSLDLLSLEGAVLSSSEFFANG
jgi:hypothetical protein